jgi:hypothetical protein
MTGLVAELADVDLERPRTAAAKRPEAVAREHRIEVMARYALQPFFHCV